jgi:hypothetical protein
MSLSPGEREALHEIEGQLRQSDPRLAAMLTYSATGRARGWLARLPSRGRAQVTRLLVVAACLALLIGLAVAGVLTAPAARSPWRVQHPGNGLVPASAYPHAPTPQGRR